MTHGSDRSLWALAVPWLQPSQLEVATEWLDAIAMEVKNLKSDAKPVRAVREMLTLKEDRTIEWTVDSRWEDMMKLVTVLPGESTSSKL